MYTCFNSSALFNEILLKQSFIKKTDFTTIELTTTEVSTDDKKSDKIVSFSYRHPLGQSFYFHG